MNLKEIHEAIERKEPVFLTDTNKAKDQLMFTKVILTGVNQNYVMKNGVKSEEFKVFEGERELDVKKILTRQELNEQIEKVFG